MQSKTVANEIECSKRKTLACHIRPHHRRLIFHLLRKMTNTSGSQPQSRDKIFMIGGQLFLQKRTVEKHCMNPQAANFYFVLTPDFQSLFYFLSIFFTLSHLMVHYRAISVVEYRSQTTVVL